MISGRAEKRSVHSRLRLKLAEGTTLAMIAWSISFGSIWSRFITCSSQIAYSSAVRRASVAECQTPLQSEPSKTAKTVFVYAGSYYRAIFTQNDSGIFPASVNGLGFNLTGVGGSNFNFPQGRNVTQDQ